MVGRLQEVADQLLEFRVDRLAKLPRVVIEFQGESRL
jgi:hypothetical protein